MDNKETNETNENNEELQPEEKAVDPETVKKAAGVAATVFLSIGIILTGFVFGREKPEKVIQTRQTGTVTAAPQETQVTAAPVTTTELLEETTQATKATETKATEATKATKATKKPKTTTSATQPPATQPPATEPPATQPPATQPPATEPPATQPPATEPPATQPPATQPPATQPPATQKPQTQKPVQSSGKVSVSANVSNSWESEGKKFCQVDFVVKNDSDSAVSGWTVKAVFSGNIEVSQNWNGSVAASGNSVTVTPESYNSEIAPGTEVTFGLIVSSAGDITVTKAVVS